MLVVEKLSLKEREAGNYEGDRRRVETSNKWKLKSQYIGTPPCESVPVWAMNGAEGAAKSSSRLAQTVRGRQLDRRRGISQRSAAIKARLKQRKLIFE